ncbi:MAG: hypothetical protein GY942_20545 [Aestuariibacter sp.]|nr:hypothetical protein [Aestuariibacter sp.]
MAAVTNYPFTIIERAFHYLPHRFPSTLKPALNALAPLEEGFDFTYPGFVWFAFHINLENLTSGSCGMRESWALFSGNVPRTPHPKR